MVWWLAMEGPFGVMAMVMMVAMAIVGDGDGDGNRDGNHRNDGAVSVSTGKVLSR